MGRRLLRRKTTRLAHFDRCCAATKGRLLRQLQTSPWGARSGCKCEERASRLERRDAALEYLCLRGRRFDTTTTRDAKLACLNRDHKKKISHGISKPEVRES